MHVPLLALGLGLEAVLVLEFLDQLGIALGVFLGGRVGIDGRCSSVLLGWAGRGVRRMCTAVDAYTVETHAVMVNGG